MSQRIVCWQRAITLPTVTPLQHGSCNLRLVATTRSTRMDLEEYFEPEYDEEFDDDI